MIQVSIKNINNEVIDQHQAVDQQAADAWLARQKHYAGMTVEIIDRTEELAKLEINQKALAYLVETDWMVVRQMETGIAIPEDVLVLRQEARQKIVK
jgi:hypothetical protein